MIQFTDSFLCLTFCIILSNYCYVSLTQKLWTKFRSSFSMGELLITSQLSMAYLSPSSACIVTKMMGSTKSYLFCSSNTPNLVLQVITKNIYHLMRIVLNKYQIIFVGIALIVVSQTVDNRMRNWRQLFDILLITSIIFFTYCLLFFILRMNPIIWLIDFMFYDSKRVSFEFLKNKSKHIIHLTFDDRSI